MIQKVYSGNRPITQIYLGRQVIRNFENTQDIDVNKVPYISTYYIKPTVDCNEDVTIDYYVTDYMQKDYQEGDQSERFTIEYWVDDARYSVSNVLAGDHGQERYLVREYMKDIIPKEILCKTERSKGLQSADFVWRLKRGKAEMIKCIKKAIEEKQYIYLFDKDKVIKLLKAYQDDKIGSYEIRKLLYVKEFDEFVSMFCRKDE